MTKVLLACLLLIAAGSSVARTFACQHVATAGLKWAAGSWATKTFVDPHPFFIGLTPDGKTIDPKTVTPLFGGLSTSCSEAAWISCSSALGDFLYFDLLSLNGAVASMGGAIGSHSKEGNTIYVSPFVCQQM